MSYIAGVFAGRRLRKDIGVTDVFEIGVGAVFCDTIAVWPNISVVKPSEDSHGDGDVYIHVDENQIELWVQSRWNKELGNRKLGRKVLPPCSSANPNKCCSDNTVTTRSYKYMYSFHPTPPPLQFV